MHITNLQLREDLERGGLISFDAIISPHDVASLLKEYFRDLPEPLLCRSLYPAFLATQSENFICGSTLCSYRHIVVFHILQKSAIVDCS